MQNEFKRRVVRIRLVLYVARIILRIGAAAGSWGSLQVKSLTNDQLLGMIYYL